MKNLRLLRERKGWSQQKLADELFVSQQSVYKYENGLAYPSLKTLQLMSKLFHVSIDFIVGNEFSDRESDPNIFPLSSSETQLIDDFRSLNKQQQKALMALVKSIST